MSRTWFAGYTSGDNYNMAVFEAVTKLIWAHVAGDGSGAADVAQVSSDSWRVDDIVQ